MSALRIVAAGVAILGTAIYLKHRQQRRLQEEHSRELAKTREARAAMLAEHNAELKRIRERGKRVTEAAQRYLDMLENHPKRGTIEAIEDAGRVIRVNFTGKR